VNKLPISEIFLSIQGEGYHIGYPSTFIRVQGCNLRCPWCDTKYTWEVKEEGYMYITDILNKVLEFKCPYVILTGGEPLTIQDNLKELIIRLKEYLGVYIDVETNGTIKLSNEFWQLVDHITVSPKQNMTVDWFGDKKSYSNINKTHFKFVYDDDNMDFIEKVIMDMQLSKKQVVLMSKGTDRDELIEKDKKLVEICKKNGFTFSPRLQCYLWGNKRGV